MGPGFVSRWMGQYLRATTLFIRAVILLTSAVGCNRPGPAPGSGPAPAPPVPPAEVDELLDEFRTQVWAVLAKLNKQGAESELAAIVDKYATPLRPEKGSKTYTSQDKAFALVIAANGTNGERGGDAQAEDKEARLVLAVAGDGSPARGGNRAGSGGQASARAPSGVAVALGGHGGEGGGAGGNASAEGKVGGIGWGGPGGKGSGSGGAGGAGGSGSGSGTVQAIIAAAEELRKN